MAINPAVFTRRTRRIKGLVLAALVGTAAQAAYADTLRGASTPLDALAGTAAIVEGNVDSVRYTFDASAGPRTVANLSEITTVFGDYRERSLAIATLGGPIDERRGLFIPELPRLAEGTRYLVFLNNIDWFFSPVVDNYVFRIERTARGTEALIAPSGHAVVGLSAEGIELTPEPVVDTHVELADPNAQPRFLEGAAEQLALAMSKDDFLASVRGLLEGTPLSGSFSPTPSRDRVWNRIQSIEEPAPPRVANH